MINLNNLGGLKLVRSENIANGIDVDRAIEEAVTQGSQGWGVIDEQSVLLAVLLQLRVALETIESTSHIAAELEQTANALKGKQMELGRVQKSLTEITKRHGGLLDVIKAQSETIAEVTAERDAARTAGIGLLADEAQRNIDLT